MSETKCVETSQVERLVRVEYVVQLEDGVWLADMAGDPGRTCDIRHAQRYVTKQIAEYEMANAQTIRGFANAEINEA